MTNPSDKGSYSYGSYQIASGTPTMSAFMNYLKNNQSLDSDPYYNDIYTRAYTALGSIGGASAANKGTNNFISTWQDLATDPRFVEVQHNFIEANNFQPVYNYAKTLIPDLDNRSSILQDIIWSGAVQHGGIKDGVLKPAWQGKQDSSDQELINLFYDQRINYVQKIQLNYLIPRYNSERQKALNMLKTQ